MRCSRSELFSSFVSKSKMEVLNGSKSVLIQTFLYKKIPRSIWLCTIPYVILNVLFIMPMLVTNLLMIYRIYLELLNDGGLKEISGSLYISLGSASAIFIYISLAINSNPIISLFECIEDTVNERKKSIYI